MPEPLTLIDKLERRIAKGDDQAMREYTKDALLNHRDSKKELRRRTAVLVDILLEPRTVTPYVCLAKLTALGDDSKSWSIFVGKFEDVEPGIGYFSWQALKRYAEDDALCDKWLFAVERSAEKGHFPARLLLARLEYENATLFKRPFAKLKWAMIEVERQDLAAKKPKDRKLIERFLI